MYIGVPPIYKITIHPNSALAVCKTSGCRYHTHTSSVNFLHLSLNEQPRFRITAVSLPNFSEMLGALVQTPSVSNLSRELDCSNRAVVELLATWLEDLDFDISIQTLPNESKFNLVARKGKGRGGLLLSGHTDTVACNADQWTSDPFELKSSDGKLYGLGTG
ncbi:MAG: M20/M25/M40 family metallo-hydrolase, partial [Gammaproteobacteria bacterium]|nr:M20/M25/M40 family metallo-hydrolase [Gammaproteobacteria bacterium]